MFQSTRPRRGATVNLKVPSRFYNVSIHAPPKGRDMQLPETNAGLNGFNPRAPEGARRAPLTMSSDSILFQSTRPRRGATSVQTLIERVKTVSIHAPPKGRDRVRMSMNYGLTGFNPRAPEGARRSPLLSSSLIKSCFNPRAPEGARLFGLSKRT